MPEISSFFGMIVAMFYDDHALPHFHVRYGDQRPAVATENLGMLRGRLTPRALNLITEWAERHQEELRADWGIARQPAPLKPVPPLECVIMKDVVEVRPRGKYRLYLRFEDGVTGEADLSKAVSFDGVFAAFNDEHEFARVNVKRDLVTICWPGGADLDPDVLYALVRGLPIPDLTLPSLDSAADG